MVKINNSQTGLPITGNDDKNKTKPENNIKTEQKTPSVLEKDKLNFTTGLKNNKPDSDNLNVFGDKGDNKKPNGWKVKTVSANFGYVVDNNVIHTGPMKIVNEKNGTDLTITGYKQVDRKNWENINPLSGHRFAPDEPQFNLGVNVGFENNFGVELDAKHNKIIMDGYDQNVHFEGMMNGKYVNETAPLNTFMQQHENTFGNMQISTLGTYKVDLPAPKDHKFSFITKLGPSLVTTNTHSRVKNPSGEFDNGTSKFAIAGYGGIAENGLRYQFGPKVGRLGVEATHSISYLNYANYSLVGGSTASHSAVYNSFAVKLTMGISGNKK